MPVRVLHLITGLETGGAETALHSLLQTLDAEHANRFEHQVVSLIRPGHMGRRIRDLGVPVAHLGMSRGAPTPGAVFRLAGLVQHFAPHLLQSWLYHADLLGLLGSWLTVGRSVPVIWNLRSAYMDFSKYPRTTAWTVRACSWFSGRPEVVVANSRAAIEHHAALGYTPKRVEVIPNGVDTGRFRPDPAVRGRLLDTLCLPPETLLAGMAGRFDPMKDVGTLLAALAGAARTQPNLHLVLCGTGMDGLNEELMTLLREHDVQDRVHLLGHRPDLERVLPGLDLLVSSSLGESFPNVVAEALACGVPVAATDAGASRELVLGAGEHQEKDMQDDRSAGRIVPTADPAALGSAMAELLGLSEDARREMGRWGRKRMQTGYSWSACAARYAALYEEVAR